MSSKEVQLAKSRCKELGVSFTKKRRNVFECLSDYGRAASAYDVIELYNEAYDDKISAMSVYRILDFLVDVNLVHKLSQSNKYSVCNHIDCGCEHEIIQLLICEKCLRVDEVNLDPELFGKLNQNATKNGFYPQNTVLEMSCICVECR